MGFFCQNDTLSNQSNNSMVMIDSLIKQLLKLYLAG
jgi:hypothetical protein